MKNSKLLIFTIVLASGALFFKAEGNFKGKAVYFTKKDKKPEFNALEISKKDAKFFSNSLFGSKNRNILISKGNRTEPKIEPKQNLSRSSKRAIDRVFTNKKIVALTFDADMTYGMERDLKNGRVKSWYNEGVIKTLDGTKIPATLFLTGLWIKNYPEETKKLAADPLFELANHSYSHPGFTNPCYGLPAISDNMNDQEIAKTDDLLKEYAPNYKKYFRFPGLCHDDSDIRSAEKYGYKVIDGDVKGLDGFNYDPEAIISRVVSRVRPGSIIVLHMHGGPNAPETGNALPEIIRRLKEKRYEFVKVSELLGGF